jgi:hypothetical protein
MKQGFVGGFCTDMLLEQQRRLLFELMVLEGAQADMSSSSILALCDGFRFV